MTERVCEWCEGDLSGKRTDAHFCSDACRYAAWVESRGGSRDNGSQRLSDRSQGSRPTRNRGRRAQIEVYPHDYTDPELVLTHVPASLLRKIRAAEDRLEAKR